MKLKFRAAVLAVLAPAALATAAVAASTGAASAATQSAAAVSSSPVGGPLAGPYCGGDICTEVYLPVNAPDFSQIVVQVWAWHSTFGGHVELQVPGVRKPYNSHDTTNRAGVTAYLFEVPNNNGRFTVTAWKKTGGTYASIGVTGFNGAVF